MSGDICTQSWSVDFPIESRIALAVTFGVIGTMSLASNGAMIYALFKTKQTGMLTARFTIAMCLSDLCHGLFFDFPLGLGLILHEKTCVFERVAVYATYCLAYFSYLMLLSIAFTRHVHLGRHSRLYRFVEPRKTLIVIIIAFIFANTFAVLITTVYRFAFRLSLNVFNVIGVVVAYVIYSLALRSVRHQRHQTTNTLASRQEKSLANIIKLLLVLMALCYGPYNVITTFYFHTKLVKEVEPSETIKILLLWSYALVACLSFSNAILLAYVNSRVRIFLKGHLTFPRNSVDSVPPQATISQDNQPQELRVK